MPLVLINKKMYPIDNVSVNVKPTTKGFVGNGNT
jgi:hypothetical protein